MATNKGNMSDDLFRHLIKEDYWISHIAKACEGVSKEGAHLYWRTVTYPDEYYVSEEQISIAKKELKRRHDEMIAGIKKGELCFMAMGMDYEPTKEDEIGNHRICCEFTNLDGVQFFIDFSTGIYVKGEYYVSFSIERDLERKREKERDKVINWNKRHERLAWKAVPDVQDYYNAKGAEGCIVKKTWNDVLRFINRTYKCNYESARLFEHFIVNTSEYVCHC